MVESDARAVEARMQALLDGIDYDFSQFTMSDFAHWLEEKRGRKIVFVPYHFKRPRVSGAWLADETYDYVFYETQDAAPVLQAHSQLHELAHMLCGHSTAQVGLEELALLLHPDDTPACSSLLLRSAQLDEDEMEAEILAALIQEKVLSNSRLQELLKVVSLDPDMEAYLKSLKME